MALTTNLQSETADICNVTFGQVVTDAGAAAVTTLGPFGFIPRYVQWVNRTSLVMLEWFEGMAANTAIRTTAAGVRTLDVSNGITLGTVAAGTAGTFSVNATDIPVSSSFSWKAIG